MCVSRHALRAFVSYIYYNICHIMLFPIYLYVFLSNLMVSYGTQGGGMVDARVAWPLEEVSPPAILLLFHGCRRDGADWFRLPEEVRFSRAAEVYGPLEVHLNS